MGKVVLSGYIEVPDGDLEAVRRELPNHIDLTRQEEGCVSFEVTESAAWPNRFHVREEFADNASFEHHQKRIRNSRWSEVTINVARHYEVTGE